MDTQNTQGGLSRYLSKIEVWALSVGCAVGWGAFVMPGTTFLPLAGPLGTALGMLFGAAIMLLIGVNYHFLMNKYPDVGGTLTYSVEVFGYDHGFLSAWFLILVYIAIMWANATAIVLIFRNLFGSALQIGFHYQVAGYDVYMGEVILTVITILAAGFICIKNKRCAARLQTVLAVSLVAGVFICAVAVFNKNGGTAAAEPFFAPTGKSGISQIANIVVLAPWAFVGFESISNSTQGFKFSPKKSLWIMLSSLTAGLFCYAALTYIAASARPEGYESWTGYINDLAFQGGYAGIPVFYAVHKAMGTAGAAILGITVTAGIVTGLIGNYIAASRMLYAMSADEILPPWFGRLDKNENPVNALKFLMAVSVVVPFAGRAAIGWIVDVNTIGALIAYTYTSAAAFKLARDDKNTAVQITGILGAAVSTLFFLYFMIPNIWTVSTLSTESYLILIAWSVFGLIFFRLVFSKDRSHRFGKTTAVWVTLLFMIFFTSMLWLREATHETTNRVLVDLNDYNIDELEANGVLLSEEDKAEANAFLEKKMDEVGQDMASNSWIQMTVIVTALLVMFNIYKAMLKREKDMEIQKLQAEESSRAKSVFLSNMSHDIRTPMNAIIGYTDLALKEKDTPEKVTEYLKKIEGSSRHLLALINDVLEMSRIENGKMELEVERSDLKEKMDEVYDMFSTQMSTKGIDYKVNTDSLVHRYVYCDANRLNRVLLNLISNAFKFTPEGGSVTVTLSETDSSDEKASYVLSVKDSGMGMSPEFAATVFEEYSREKTASSIQGTGLGMAITKSIIELMGGSIRVESVQHKGTEFIIELTFDLAEEGKEQESISEEDIENADFSGLKILLADDNEINREIAMILLEEAGFEVDTAENGKEAFEKVSASKPGDYCAVLMDIQMPVMNGYEATAAIRKIENEELSRIPIVAMTANAFKEDVEAARQAGMDAHVAKPIDVKQLMATLVKVLSNL
ncbi:MAG: amino acid permease [Lachnospiraceae bacterium]|nr:amino acid permease [Lachnospiraceae bacterium]